MNMKKYMQISEIIDWQHPTILELAKKVASSHQTSEAIAKACFEWVRDEIYHSCDYQMNPVTCKASDVLKYRTGLRQKSSTSSLTQSKWYSSRVVLSEIKHS